MKSCERPNAGTHVPDDRVRVERSDEVTLDPCPKHGWIGHALLHESAHAVFAARLGFPFVQVAVYPYEQIVASANPEGEGIAGGVLMVESDPTLWIPQRPEDALDLLVAGSLAEGAYLGHMLPNGWKGDMRRFGIGMGIEQMTPDLALQVREARKRVESSVRANEDAIMRVARSLSSQLTPDGPNRYKGFNKPIVLDQQQVLSLVNP